MRQSPSELHADGPGAGAASPATSNAPLSAAFSYCASFAGLPLVLQAVPATRMAATKTKELLCGAEGDRTPDLIHAMDALSQLSYGPGR